MTAQYNIYPPSCDITPKFPNKNPESFHNSLSSSNKSFFYFISSSDLFVMNQSGNED